MKNDYIFGIPDPDLRITFAYYNFGGSTMNIIKVICENNARPCVKRRMSFCAWSKCLNAVVLADVDLPYWTSKVEHIAALSRGSKTITFLESPTLICLFTIHLRWLYNECN